MAAAGTLAPAQPTANRITEDDADYKRLHAATVRRLTSSVRLFVRELRRAPDALGRNAAAQRFVQRHTALLRDAYTAGWRVGTGHYFAPISRRGVPHVPPTDAQMGRQLAFYAPSVAKMAAEALGVFNHTSQASTATPAPSHALTEVVKLYSPDQLRVKGKFAFEGGARHDQRLISKHQELQAHLRQAHEHESSGRGALEAAHRSVGKELRAKGGRATEEDIKAHPRYKAALESYHRVVDRLGDVQDKVARLQPRASAAMRRETIREVFGRDVSREELGRLVGKKPGHGLLVKTASQRLGQEPDRGYSAHVFLDTRSRKGDSYGSMVIGKLTPEAAAARGLHAGSVMASDVDVRTGNDSSHRRAESGIELLRAVNHMRDMGIERVEASAARSPDHNGYDTWAKLGGEGELPRSHAGGLRDVREMAQKTFGAYVTRVEHVMDQPGGPKWWRKNGDTFAMSMDLRPGGRAARTLDRIRGALERHGHSLSESELEELLDSVLLAESPDAIRLADGDALGGWQAGLSNRVVLQAEVVWPAMQDGYAHGGAVDPSAPFAHLWWQLNEGIKTQHCSDCPWVAYNSPYDPPGSGGNELAQTPGDGRTECGAGCKCSLSYGGWMMPEDADWIQYMTPPDAPWRNAPANPGLIPSTVRYQGWNPGRLPIGVDAEGNYVYAGTPQETSLLHPREALYGTLSVRAIDGATTELSNRQILALDRFRSAWSRWDRVRGDRPAARSLFGYVWNEQTQMFQRPSATAGMLVPTQQGYRVQDFPASWDDLTPAQQRALQGLWDAIVGWNEANETDALTASEDTGESWLLYDENQARDSHGRWTFEGRTARIGELQGHIAEHQATIKSLTGLKGRAATEQRTAARESIKGHRAEIAEHKTAIKSEKEAAAAKVEQSRPGVVQHIAVRDIHVGLNPREHFDPEKIAELAASIKEHGLLQPISVRPHQGGYQIIAGERRFRAIQALGETHVPALVHHVDDQKARELAIIENVVRADMRPIETARAYGSLRDGGLSVKQIAERTGKSAANIQQHLDLLELHPHVAQAIDEGRLPQGVIRDMAKLTHAGQLEATERILAGDLGVRSAKTLIKSIGAREMQTNMFPTVHAVGKLEADARAKYEKAIAEVTKHLAGLDDETMGRFARVVAEPDKERERLGLMVKQLRRMQDILEYAKHHREATGLSETEHAAFVALLTADVVRLSEQVESIKLYDPNQARDGRGRFAFEGGPRQHGYEANASAVHEHATAAAGGGGGARWNTTAPGHQEQKATHSADARHRPATRDAVERQIAEMERQAGPGSRGQESTDAVGYRRSGQYGRLSGRAERLPVASTASPNETGMERIARLRADVTDHNRWLLWHTDDHPQHAAILATRDRLYGELQLASREHGSTLVEQRIAEHEANLRKLGGLRGAILDREGLLIGHATNEERAPGAHGVPHLVFHAEAQGGMRGATVVIYHPSGKPPTMQEVALLAAHGAHELRVLTPDARYTLRPGSEGWDAVRFAQHIAPAIRTAQAQHGQLDAAAWAEVANATGLQFTSEPVDGVTLAEEWIDWASDDGEYVALMGGHEPGYDAQGHGQHGHWLPGHGDGPVTHINERVRETLHSHFGRSLSDEEVAHLAGARHGDRVEVGRVGSLTTHSEDGTRRTTHIMPGAKVSYGQHVDAHGNAVNIDAERLATQARQAQKLGATSLHWKTRAGTSDISLLHRLGYDAPLDVHTMKETTVGEHGHIPEHIGHPSRVSDLVRTAEGRAWWEGHAMNPAMHFDLTPGSESWRKLDAYLREHHGHGVEEYG